MAEKRVMPHDEVVRRVIAHHHALGELVDFRLIVGGAIVGCYRVRRPEEEAWRDLLPTDTSPRKYQETIQRLAPALFPGEALTIRAIERPARDVVITVEPDGSA